MKSLSLSFKLLFYILTAPSNRYKTVGVFLLAICGILSVYLNIQGIDCLTKISQYNSSTTMMSNKSGDVQTITNLERDCFIITNSYVFSLFGVVIGMIILVVDFLRKRK